MDDPRPAGLHILVQVQEETYCDFHPGTRVELFGPWALGTVLLPSTLLEVRDEPLTLCAMSADCGYVVRQLPAPRAVPQHPFVPLPEVEEEVNPEFARFQEWAASMGLVPSQTVITDGTDPPGDEEDDEFPYAEDEDSLLSSEDEADYQSDDLLQWADLEDDYPESVSDEENKEETGSAPTVRVQEPEPPTVGPADPSREADVRSVPPGDS